MVFKSALFRRVTIVGVGLIGGSVGMAVKKYKLAREVIGISQRNSSMVYAVENKAIDRAETDMKRAISGADLVVLASPVASIIDLMSTIGPFLRRNCIITDVGSTKASIVEAAERNLPNPSFFIGSHPLAGSEKKGANYASADLFSGATCILTPTDKTNRLARDKVKHFWTKCGAQTEIMSPEDHDKAVTYISHLPHLMAYGLIRTVPKEFLQYASQGLKDTTRIAASSPQVWNDICMANSNNIIKSMDEMIGNLSELRKSILTRDNRDLMNFLEGSKKKRDELDKA